MTTISKESESGTLPNHYRDALRELTENVSLMVRIYGDADANAALKRARSILNSSERKDC